MLLRPFKVRERRIRSRPPVKVRVGRNRRQAGIDAAFHPSQQLVNARTSASDRGRGTLPAAASPRSQASPPPARHPGKTGSQRTSAPTARRFARPLVFSVSSCGAFCPCKVIAHHSTVNMAVEFPEMTGASGGPDRALGLRPEPPRGCLRPSGDDPLRKEAKAKGTSRAGFEVRPSERKRAVPAPVTGFKDRESGSRSPVMEHLNHG